jgi:hypothetical protein
VLRKAAATNRATLVAAFVLIAGLGRRVQYRTRLLVRGQIPARPPRRDKLAPANHNHTSVGQNDTNADFFLPVLLDSLLFFCFRRHGCFHSEMI